eukprot:180325_1
MMKPKWSNPFEAAKANSHKNVNALNVSQNEIIVSTSSMDYLTPQNQPSYQEIQNPNQLQIDSMYNKVKKRRQSTETNIQNNESHTTSNTRRTDQYKELELLHHGRLYKTYKCLNLVDQNEYAIKQDAHNTNEQQTDSLMRECHVLSSLQTHGSICNHIVRYVDMFTESNVSYLVLECCKSNIASLKLDQMNKNNEELLIKIILHISRALEFLHGNKWIHFNVNPHNILVTNDMTFKLTDFKFARHFSSCNNDEQNFSKIPRLMGYQKSDAKYLSSEMVNQQIQPQLLNKIDIFSLGFCVFDIVLSETLPMIGDDKDSWNEIRKEATMIHKLSQDGTRLSSNFKQLIIRMISENLCQRPDADKLAHVLHRFEDEVLKEKDTEIMRLKQKLQSIVQELRQKQSQPQNQQPISSSTTGSNGRKSRLSNVYAPN